MRSIDPHVGRGFLQIDDFRRLLDENPSLKLIELSNYGEIFLNSRVPHCGHAVRRKIAILRGLGDR